jgi:hypothetical protein
MWSSPIVPGIKLTMPRSLRNGLLRKKWVAEKVQEQWEKTTWAQKIADRAKVFYLALNGGGTI